MLVLLLAHAPPALAHRPHDPITTLAVAPDFAASGRAWAVFDPHDVSQLLRSDDGGAHWDFAGGPPVADVLVDAMYWDGALLLLGDANLWVTQDEGETWTAHPLDAPGTALAPGLLGTTSGVFAGDLVAGSWSRVAEGGVVDVAVGPGGEALALLSGALLVDGERVELPAEAWGLSVAADEAIYVGTDGAGVLRLDGESWSVCGPLPAWRLGVYTLSAPALAISDDGALLAASGHQSIFRSADGCESWTLDDSGEEIPYGGIGNANDPAESFTALVGGDGYAVTAGFTGISVSEGDGATWREAAIVQGDYARGVAFAPDWPTDSRIYVGGYGGGTWWSWDGGQTWEGSARDMIDAYAYDVQPGADGDTLFFSGSLAPYRSTDGGRRWALIDVPMKRIRAFRQRGGLTFAVGEDNDGIIQGQLAWSGDGGETWSESEGLYAVMQAAPREIVIADDGAWLVATDQPAALYGSWDDGASWSELYLGAETPSAGVVAVAGGPAGRILFAAPEDGLLLSDDGGETWLAHPGAPEGAPRHLIAADDGAVFLVVRSGQIWRSDDAGDSWVAAGAPMPAAVHDLATSPDFATHGALLVGTHDGVLASWDRGGSWSRLPRFARLEATSHHVECQAVAGCRMQVDCATWQDESAGLGEGVWLEPDGQLQISTTATGLQVLGPPDGEIALWIDGELSATLAAPFSIDDLPAGWKEISLRVASGGALPIDAIEVWEGGDPLPVAPSCEDCVQAHAPVDVEAGGCGGGAAWLAPLLIGWRRRR